MRFRTHFAWRGRFFLFAWGILWSSLVPAIGQGAEGGPQAPPAGGAEKSSNLRLTIDPVEALPPALKEYRGRKIADYMHYAGAEWLIRDNREAEERASLVLENLGVKPGQVVCDMGCGNGFYSLSLAKLVGERGKVLAVDIQPEMLRLLQARAERESIKNIEPILGTAINPNLPDGKVDLILCVDVYHEFSHPEHMLAAMRKALSREGQVVLVEFRAEDPKVPIKALHKMTKEQVLKELPPNGFKLVHEFDRLPWQHMMFFGRDEKAGLTK